MHTMGSEHFRGRQHSACCKGMVALDVGSVLLDVHYIVFLVGIHITHNNMQYMIYFSNDTI